jgi:hypothetical protein
VAIDVDVDDLDVFDRRIDALVDAVAEHAGSVGVIGADRYTVRVSVEGADAFEAVRAARTVVARAARKAGLPAGPVLRLDALTEAELAAELARPTFPDVVGTTEVTKILGVSRQRLAELRRRSEFPEPIVDLAAGPVWLQTSIDAFVKRWDRRPGRPRSAAQA